MISNRVKNIESIRSLAQILTIPTFRKIIKDGVNDNAKKRINKHLLRNFEIKNNFTNQKFIKELYALLKNRYRNEYLFKNEILNKLIFKKYKLETTIVLNEFKISKSIADLLLINGEVKLFEIKTSLDNLDRLSLQLRDYKKAIEKIYVVGDTKNINAIYNIFKHDNFGIIEYTNDNELNILKEARKDKSFFDNRTLFKMLRKEEYTNVMKKFYDKIPNVPNVLYFKTYLELALKINTIEFQKQVFKEIRKRNQNNLNYLYSDKTPYELKYICYCLNLSDNEYENLYKYLRKPL